MIVRLSIAIALMLFASVASAQQVYMPQQVGVVQQRITYPTPIRSWLFGSSRSTPIYQYRPYRVVTPPPRPVYVQPPSYLVPMQPQPYQLRVVR